MARSWDPCRRGFSSPEVPDNASEYDSRRKAPKAARRSSSGGRVHQLVPWAGRVAARGSTYIHRYPPTAPSRSAVAAGGDVRCGERLHPAGASRNYYGTDNPEATGVIQDGGAAEAKNQRQFFFFFFFNPDVQWQSGRRETHRSCRRGGIQATPHPGRARLVHGRLTPRGPAFQGGRSASTPAAARPSPGVATSTKIHAVRAVPAKSSDKGRGGPARPRGTASWARI